MPDADLPDLFAASDCCVNLRYPTAGETSAAVLRLMSAGLPTIVTDTGAFSDLPDDAVLKVPPNAFEGEILVAYLRALATNLAFRRTIGANARAFVEREHTMRRATEGYLDVLGEVTGMTLPHERISAPPDPPKPTPGAALPPPLQSAQAPAEMSDDALTAPIAHAIADLGLAGHPALVEQTARAMAEMHLGVKNRKRTR